MDRPHPPGDEPPIPTDAAGRASVVALLREAPTVAAAGHLPLDGDGLGSALGLVHSLRAAGREAWCVVGGDVPRNLRFLPGIDDAVPAGSAPRASAAFVALDGGDETRFGPLVPHLRAARSVLDVDHHVSHSRFGAASWVDANYAATGLMVLDLIDDLALPLPYEAALCLYVALVTDTGRFSYSNTSPAAHRAAARLLRCGVRPDEVLGHVYRSLPRGRLALSAEVARRLGVSADGRIAWTEVTLEMCREAGVSPIDAHDAVEVPASLEGVEVAAVFREQESGTHVSLRSSHGFDVSAFAVARGGGGHRRASGFPIDARPADAARIVIPDLERELAAWRDR